MNFKNKLKNRIMFPDYIPTHSIILKVIRFIRYFADVSLF